MESNTEHERAPAPPAPDRAPPRTGGPTVEPGLTAQPAGQQTRTMRRMLRSALPPGAVQMVEDGDTGDAPAPSGMEKLETALGANDGAGAVAAWGELTPANITTLKANEAKSKQVVALLATVNATKAAEAAWALSGSDVAKHIALCDTAWNKAMAEKTVALTTAAQQDTLVRNHWDKLAPLVAGTKAQAALPALAGDSALFLGCCKDSADFATWADKLPALRLAVAAPNAEAAQVLTRQCLAADFTALGGDVPLAASVIALIAPLDEAWAAEVGDKSWVNTSSLTDLMGLFAAAWNAFFAEHVLGKLNGVGQNLAVQNHIASFLLLQPKPAHEVFSKLHANAKADFLARYNDTPDFKAWVKPTVAFDAAYDLNNQAEIVAIAVTLRGDDFREIVIQNLKARAIIDGLHALRTPADAEQAAHLITTGLNKGLGFYIDVLQPVWGATYEPLALARATDIGKQENWVRGYLDRLPNTMAAQSANAAFPLLHADADRFAACYAGVPAFQTWCDRDNLEPVLAAAPNSGWRSKWLRAIKAMGMETKTMKTIRDKVGVAAWREAAVVQAGLYGWVLGKLGTPVGSEEDATFVKALYADGTGVKAEERFATYRALYTAPLLESGSVHNTPVSSNPVASGGSDDFDTSIRAVTPNDPAMHGLLTQFGLLPRQQVNLAARVIMATEWADRAVTVRPSGRTTFYKDQSDKWVKTATPIYRPLTTSYYINDGTFLLFTYSNDAGFVNSRLSADPMSHAGRDGSGSAYTYFQNHAVHEIGHVVGDKTLDGVGKPDDAMLAGAGWEASDVATFAAQYGFDATLIGANYALQKSPTDPVKNLTGADIADFLSKYLEGSGTSGCRVCTELGVDGATAFALIQGSPTTSAIAGTAYVSTVIPGLKGKDKANWYHLPAAPTAVGGKVTLYSTRWGNKWARFNEAYYTNRPSDYGISSPKEMFAELYTAHYSSQGVAGGLAAATAIFTALDAADSADFT